MSDTLEAQVTTRVDVLALAARARALAMERLPPRRAHELSLVIAELAGNTVRHATCGAIRVSVRPNSWSVTVVDHGPGFTDAVLRDGGRSDRLGPEGVRAPDAPHTSFGSGLASARRLATRLTLDNLPTGGARATAEWVDATTTDVSDAVKPTHEGAHR